MAPDTLTRRNRASARTALAAGVLALALTACGSSRNSGASSASIAPAADVDAGAGDGGGGKAVADEQGAGDGFSSAPSGGALAGGSTATSAATLTADEVAAVDRKVIVTVTLDVVVDDVGAAAVKAATIAEGTGGYVFSQQTNLGERPSSSIVLKVPPSKVGGLLTTLGSLGTVLSQTQQAEDVTAQFVDLDSRITAARASVARVREFLDRTTNVGELAGLESELTRRQTELEQLLGQQRVLASRADLATVTLTLVPPAGGDERGDGLSPSSALRRGVDSIVNVGRGIGVVGAFLLPWSPVVLLVVGLLAVRRRRRREVGVMVPPAQPEREKVDA